MVDRRAKLLVPGQGNVVVAVMRDGTLHGLPLPPSPQPGSVTLVIPD